MVTFGESFVERAEHALVEILVLSELDRSGPLGMETLAMRVIEFGDFDEKVDRDFVEASVKRLVRGNHVEKRDGRFGITADGREDVGKLANILCCVTGAVASAEGLATVQEVNRTRTATP